MLWHHLHIGQITILAKIHINIKIDWIKYHQKAKNTAKKQHILDISHIKVIKLILSIEIGAYF